MTINLSVPVTHELKPRITVIGVGGAGGNAVNNMITAHLEGVDFIVANTDAQALSQGLTERRIQLGAMLTQGLGAGARPDVGRAAAEEVLETIADHLQGTNMVFVTAGMGGGTGTGAAPVVARAARDLGLLTVGVVTKPFHFEGKQRMRVAEEGIAQLQECVDTLIVIPNQNLFRIANENTTFADAFKMADDVLYSGVRGVTDLMVMPGLINLDFADVRSVMSEMGKAMMGTGEAEGDKRALDAAEGAINNPLLDDVSLKGARGVLVNITGGPDMTLYEVDEACNHIRDQVDGDANIIFGSTFDEQLEGRVRVSVVATGIDVEASPRVEAAAGEPIATVRPTPAPQDIKPQLTPAVATPSPAPTPAPAPTFTPAPARPAALVPAAPAMAADAQPVTPRPEAAKRDQFIPPRPADPERPSAPAAQPEVMAEADLLDATQSEAPPVLAPVKTSLFERMTRTGRAKAPAAPAPLRTEPVLETVGADLAPEPAATSSAEEDLLDIPTFLRRQSN